MLKKNILIILLILLCVIVCDLLAASIISPFKHSKDVVVKQYGKSAVIERVNNLNRFETYRVIDLNKEYLVTVENGNIKVLRETEYECHK